MTSLAVMLPQEELKCKSSAEDSLSSSGVEFISDDTPAESSTFSDAENSKIEFSENFSDIGPDSERNLPDSTSNHPKSENRKKRKWKPYSKMTWIERKKLEERDARRANRIRDEMSACGFALAPYNTTQFLMEDHNIQEPDYEQIINGHHRNKENNLNYSSSDDFYSSPEDEEEFLQQQFTQDYQRIHTERLNSMTKPQLVEELISVEDKIEALQKILEDVRTQNKLEQRTLRPASELEKIRVFREEIQKLKKENLALEQENEKLRIRLNRKT